MRRYAAAQGIEIVGEYEDVVSGKRELEGRTGLAALLNHVENNGVRLVVLERADRLARDLMIGEVLIDKLRGVGVTVVTTDGVDLTAGDDANPTAKMMRRLLGILAEYDRDLTVLKLRAARERIRARGEKCEGRPGYPAEIVGMIRKLRRARPGRGRRSAAAIAEELNTRGVPTMSRRPWSRGTVAGVLRRIGSR